MKYSYMLIKYFFLFKRLPKKWSYKLKLGIITKNKWNKGQMPRMSQEIQIFSNFIINLLLKSQTNLTKHLTQPIK